MPRRSELSLILLFGLALHATAALAADKACEQQQLTNFPFLKPWVEKFKNFKAPVNTGNIEGALFFATGATLVSKGASAKWLVDRATLTLPWKGKTGRIEYGPFSKDEDRFWYMLFSAAEKDLLKSCKKNECKIKFDDQERAWLTGASPEKREPMFRKIVYNRMQQFQSSAKVWPYEDTQGAMMAETEVMPFRTKSSVLNGYEWTDLAVAPEFPANIMRYFWQPKARNAFAYEVFDAEPGTHKPTVALSSRSCEQRTNYTACSEIVVYNNHYFDFWAKALFFFPFCGQEVVLAYETLDIDQVKDSRVARVLFGSEMRKLMGEVLETRLKRLNMLRD